MGLLLDVVTRDSRRDSLQLSSSLRSGQSANPLQRKRPMMQKMPLAQAKKVGAHFDRTLAVEGKIERLRG